MSATSLPSAQSAGAAIENILSLGLNSSVGRVSFLQGEMVSFTTRAGELNQEIQDLFKQIAGLSDINLALEMLNKLQQKTAVLEAMAPILDDAKHLDEDFLQLDAILQNESPDENELKILCRVARISSYVVHFLNGE